MSIQKFVPRLAPHLEVFALPDGDHGVCVGGERYVRLGREDKRIFDHIDGARDLAKVVKDTSADGKLVSIRQLLALVRAMAEAGALANPPEELLQHEFVQARPTLVTRLRRGFLSSRLESAALGRGLSWLVGWLNGVRLGATGWASYIVVGCIICGYLRWKSPPVADPLRVGQSYATGVLLLFAGVVLALFARELARLIVLSGYGLRAHAAGLTARLLFLVSPSIDARHIFRAGRAGEREIAAASLTAPVLVLTALVVRWKVAFMPAWLSGLQLLGWGVALVCWANACPLLRTDMGALVDGMRDDGEGRRHALAYMWRRLLRRQGQSDLFQGETRYVAVALGAVAWIYVGFMLATTALAALFPALGRIFDEDVTALDRGAVLSIAGFLLLLLLSSVVLFLGMLGRFLLGLLPRRAAQGKVVATDAEAAARILSNVPVFAPLDANTLQAVANTAKTLRYKAGETIVRQGEHGDTFFVIAEGTVDVVLVADSGLESVVASLGEGDGFGEMALIEDAPRNATIRTRTPTVAVAVAKTEFQNAIAAAGVSAEQVTSLLRATSALRRSDVFASLSPRALLQVIGRSTRAEHAVGEVIVREGDVGDCFYVVEAGAVSVQDASGQTHAQLGPGQVFGEIALMRNVPRTATVTCAQPSVLISLDRATFHELVVEDFGVGMQLEQKAAERLVESA